VANRSDNFNVSQSLGTPSDGGSAWSQTSGTWSSDGTQAKEGGGGAQRVCVLDAASAVGDTQVTVPNRGLDNGICWRLADDSNYILGAYNAAGTMKIFKKVAGSFTQLGITATITAANGDVLKGSVDASNNHTFYQNGMSRVTATDAAGSTNTKHGLRANGDTTVRFDDFSFTDTSGGGGATPIRRYSSLNGLSAVGPFFADPLAFAIA